MATTSRSVPVAATVCLLLLFAAVASATAGARLERGRELLAEDAGSPPVALSDEQPPDGHLSYRIVKGILEKYARMHRAYLYVPFARCMSIRVADHARIIIELRWSDRLQGKRPERPCGPGEAKRGCAQATYEYSLECLLVHL
jgi:hypothetical protein